MQIPGILKIPGILLGVALWQGLPTLPLLRPKVSSCGVGKTFGRTFGGVRRPAPSIALSRSKLHGTELSVEWQHKVTGYNSSSKIILEQSSDCVIMAAG